MLNQKQISKNHRILCSPSTITRMGSLFALKFCTEFQETLLYKSVSKFLDPRPWPERSYKIGPVFPFFHLSVSFLRIDSLVFSELSVVLGAHIQLCVTARFFGKNPHQAKIKNGQKWPQNMVFRLFKKIMSLVLSGLCVK